MQSLKPGDEIMVGSLSEVRTIRETLVNYQAWQKCLHHLHVQIVHPRGFPSFQKLHAAGIRDIKVPLSIKHQQQQQQQQHRTQDHISNGSRGTKWLHFFEFFLLGILIPHSLTPPNGECGSLSLS